MNKKLAFTLGSLVLLAVFGALGVRAAYRERVPTAFDEAYFREHDSLRKTALNVCRKEAEAGRPARDFCAAAQAAAHAEAVTSTAMPSIE